MRSAYFNCVDQSEASICFHNFFSGSGSRVCTSVLFVFLCLYISLKICIFWSFLYFSTFLFCTSVLLYLLYFLIWLDSPYELPCKIWSLYLKKCLSYESFILLYFLYFCNLLELFIRTSIQNLKSVAQKLSELCSI